MKIQILLADSAETDIASGKVHALGIGWNITTSPTPPAAIILLLNVAWDECNRGFSLDVDLHDEDGAQVQVPTQAGMAPILIHAEGEAGRPAGIKAGSEIRMPLSFNIGQGLPLVQGKRYEWKVIARWRDSGEEITTAIESFFVRFQG
ncbi:MAG: hypothetical protein LKI34_08050 [Bifidobacterium tibiigranuli]|jgi:hypothetical protein|uniref:hypothetical protein n=1 Tax=Bifidobacterium tibiigranuli TaxID=2172043 RepID=UPI0026E9698A|nr:hypothetical protein [Bifidobacterium tibiigranuli]MCI1674149.1 hypothetical protein [Bifidobacterium tibiigranuli]MCI1712490.1 hypothetical protein [Bifidobacterium tibiigranuli]